MTDLKSQVSYLRLAFLSRAQGRKQYKLLRHAWPAAQPLLLPTFFRIFARMSFPPPPYTQPSSPVAPLTPHSISRARSFAPARRAFRNAVNSGHLLDWSGTTLSSPATVYWQVQ